MVTRSDSGLFPRWRTVTQPGAGLLHLGHAALMPGLETCSVMLSHFLRCQQAGNGASDQGHDETKGAGVGRREVEQRSHSDQERDCDTCRHDI